MTIQNKLYQSQIRKSTVQQKEVVEVEKESTVTEPVTEPVTDESNKDTLDDKCREQFSKEELAHFDSVEANVEENM